MDRNNIILIIGASSGIGYECAKQYLDKQNIVYNFSRSECKLDGIINYLGDIVKAEELKNCIDKIICENKRLDKLIYSAGYSLAAPLESVECRDYKHLFNVNLFGAIDAIKAVIPIMKENNFGRIITVSSIGGILPIPFDPYYSASKAALNMFVQTLSLELNKFNIYITSIMPGGTKTRFSFKRKIYEDEQLKDYEEEFHNATNTLHDIEQNGMSDDAVAKCIVKISNMKKPPILCSSGFYNKLIHSMSKMLPKKCLNRIILCKFCKKT